MKVALMCGLFLFSVSLMFLLAVCALIGLSFYFGVIWALAATPFIVGLLGAGFVIALDFTTDTAL